MALLFLPDMIGLWERGRDLFNTNHWGKEKLAVMQFVGFIVSELPSLHSYCNYEYGCTDTDVCP